MSQNVALIYVTYDGAVNSASGVGVLSRYFIDAVPSIAKNIRKEVEIDISLHVIAVELSRAADGHSDSIRRHTEVVCRSLGGQLHLVSNGLQGKKGYGWLENWQQASRNAATSIQSISAKYDRVVVYLVDTPFMCVPFYYSQLKPSTKANVSFLIVPHSDTFSHFPDAIDQSRLGWEAAAMQAVHVFPDVYLAETSRFLIGILKDHYKIDERKIVSLQTGLVSTSPR